MKAAEEANKQLENIKIETEAILVKAQQEQMRILNEASELRNQIIQDAKENALVESQKIIEDAKRQIQIEKEKSLNEMKGQIAELSVDRRSGSPGTLGRNRSHRSQNHPSLYLSGESGGTVRNAFLCPDQRAWAASCRI